MRVGKTGSKTWALRARDLAGKAHWLTLGYHPAMGLADARIAEVVRQMAGAAGALTFGAIAHSLRPDVEITAHPKAQVIKVAASAPVPSP